MGMATCAINASAVPNSRSFRIQRGDERDLEHALFLSASSRLGIAAGGISLAVHICAHGVFLALGATFKLAASTVPRMGIVCFGTQRCHRLVECTICWSDLKMRHNRLPDASLGL